MTVYIVTRGRPENVRKIVPAWLDQRMRVRLVVDGSEYNYYRSLVRGMGWATHVDVFSPEKRDGGVGHVKRFAVENAYQSGLKSIILSDDDMRPDVNSSMHLLLREAEKPNTLGVGAVRSIHDRFSGGVTKERDDVILCPGGWGMQLFALNVRRAVKLGNFDSSLDCFGEDAELMRNGIVAGIPWAVHCGVRCNAIGARYDPGGINAYIADGDRESREHFCKEVIYKRWPNYVSHPDKKHRVQWQRMMDDFIPGWRLRSAMHNGKW